MASGRKPSGQSKHDQRVKRLANEYKKKGYEAKADVSGFSQPTTIGGLRPDVRARKGGHETVVEVETIDSVDSSRDLKQQKAFQSWAKRDPKHHYKRDVV